MPQEAQIYVNGHLTTSTGLERSYVSRNLVAGRPYIYKVHAQIERDGQMIEETLTAELRAGQTTELAFNFDQPQAAETTLKLQVPENAKVYLAGEETASTGPTRIFATDSLPAGQTWADYQIRVTIQRDGRAQSKVQTITLKSGDSRDLTFDFDAPQVAATR